MTSYSRIFYEPYHRETGEAIGPVSDYDDAVCEALQEENRRLAEFTGVEDYAQCLCAVRFVRAERLTAR